MSTSPDGELPPSLTPWQLIDARHLLDDQTFDALDDQRRRLAAPSTRWRPPWRCSKNC